jgi:hypothetical protein
MNNDPNRDQRGRGDRRRRPTSPLDSFRPRGRRIRPRRRDERRGAYFVDRFGTLTLAMVVTLLGLTIVDGVLTIELLDLNSEEINPFMGHLLDRGRDVFLIGKYILTAAGLPFLVVYQHHPMFGTRFRVGFLLPIFIGLYLVLLSYQWTLLRVGRPETTARVGLPSMAVGAGPW